MDTDETADSDLLIWEKRLVLMAAFGFVGLGAFFGICSVYFHYIKHQVEKHVAIHSISTPLDRTGNRGSEELKVSVEKVKPVSNARVITVAVETEHRQVRTLSVGTVESSEMAPTYSISMNETSSRSGSMIAKSVGTGTDEAENVELFFANIDELLDGSTADQHDAYGKLKSTGDKLKNVSDFWWRMAKATHIEAQMAEQRQDKDCQKGLLISAVACAEKAVKLNENSAESHKWLAITSGSRGEFLKINDRIQSGFIFKEHVDRALALNPLDSSLHHLLGRFCYEVSQLTWVERRMASTLFSNPPTSTVQEALHHFLEAEKLGDKPLIENRMYVARCYISTGDNPKAAFWLKSASGLTAESPSEKKAQAIVNELMNKYKNVPPIGHRMDQDN
ncbi:unnamed protein product [Allacma fusca]|uniref:Regulator of microtubule dynamics protein 2 n=1 Tax=Allacma fusca TaxID=39272 RepID=A0A8J2LL12_9HEXA|nr:unnamed protein product [Allacma fusca]